MFLDIIKISFRNLFRQKMRTTLTIISMMVGAFLIAIMLSVGNGLKQFMISQVTLFANEQTISVRAKMDMESTFGFSFGQGVQEYKSEDAKEDDSTNSNIDMRTGLNTDSAEGDSVSGMQKLMEQSMLTQDDLKKISKVKHIDEVAFETFVSPDYIRLSQDESKKLIISMYGMPQGYMKMLSFSTKDDELLKSPDCVVLSDAYAEAWGKVNGDLIGKKVLIQVTRVVKPIVDPTANVDGAAVVMPTTETKEFEMTIAGFFEKNLMSQVGFVSPQVSNEVNAYIQNVSVENFEKNEKAFELVVLVDNPENVIAVDEALGKLGYDSTTTAEAIGQIGVIFDVISAVLSSFGFVAMFVASIGIANTLLMAIYERTREIGVMKAVGATRFTVSLLFSAEALWLGLLGGAFGILSGYVIGGVANFILHQGISIGSFEIIKGYLANYPTFDISVFSVSTVVIVMSVTTGVAFLAGLYPSLRAGRLDPIVALRHD